jgi:hypothetical protein
MPSRFARLALVCAVVFFGSVLFAADSYPSNGPALPAGLTLHPDAIKARETDKIAVPGGYTFKPSSGELVCEVETICRPGKAPFTFVYTEVVSAVDNTVIPVRNVYQFASRDTAIAVRDSLSAIFDFAKRFELVESRKIGPYGNTSIEYGIAEPRPCATTMNAGLLAEKVLRYPEMWPFLFRLEVEYFASAHCPE